MDTLKVLFLGVFLLVTTVLTAQSDKVLQDAFSSSYTYEYQGDYTKAVEAIKSVYAEKSYEVNLRLGWLTYMSGLFTESLGYYQKAIALMPMSVEARLGYVYPASSLGNWEQVMTQYKEILKVDSKNSVVNYRLGLIYYGREDYTNAFKYFEPVANLYPFDYDSAIYFAWTHLKLGKVREAKVLFNKVLLMKPDDASALEGLSLIK